jgi:voltage-gated potassium channel
LKRYLSIHSLFIFQSKFTWNTEVVHIIILPYIFIIFKLIRHSRSFRLIGKALYSVREELVTAYTASFITICFSAILMYYIERNAQPDVFENIGDGIWWAIITFATVGYGDIYPITPLGKLLGCIICLVGVAMVAIPTGIISSSFMSMIQNKERQQMQAEKEQKEKRQEEKHSND